MKPPKRTLAIFLTMILVSGCGGGGGGSSMTAQRPAVMPPPPREISGARGAPILELDGRTFVGVPSAPTHTLPLRRTGADGSPIDEKGIEIHAGAARDGAGAADVLTRLRDSAAARPYGLATFSSPPLVRVASGTSREFIAAAVRAVQFINASLPYDKRIRLSADPAPHFSPQRSIPDGEIHIDFVPAGTFSRILPPGEDPVGAALGTQSSRGEAYSAQILVDEDILRKGYSEYALFHTLVHELLHALGFWSHANPLRFPRSVIRPRIPQNVNTYILGPADREALLAAYTRFRPGAEAHEISAQSLGAWTDVSTHLLGIMELEGGQSVGFGVVFRNGLFQPWASGPTPPTSLGNNRALRGTVSWDGLFLGMTPSARHLVDGDALLAINLLTLAGSLDLTNMTQTRVSDTSLSTWGDGNLRYSVDVERNSFRSTGGDDGQVAGAFFGRNHEAMGGVLERRDLSGAFGGKR